MRKYLLLIWLLLLACLPARAGLVSEKSEQNIGDQMSAQLEKEFPTTLDPRVEEIGERVVRVCNRQNLKYTFKVLENPEVNALSIGGGYVYVFRGLLDLVQTDDDMLAFVIAHEVAHVSQRHMARSLEREMVGNLLLGAILIASKASTGTYNTVSIGWDVLLRGYSRTYEFEADRVGMDYVIKSGYNPEGANKMFNYFKKGETTPKIFAILATHPPTDKRIEQLQTVYADQFTQAQALGEIDFARRPQLKKNI